MDRSVIKAFCVTGISIGLAFIFNYLFFAKMIGISVFIFAAILLGATAVLGVSQRLPVKRSWWLMLLIAFFALMVSVRANEFLIFLDVCAALGLLVLLARELTDTPAFLMRLRDYLISAVLMPLKMLGKALTTIILLGQIRSTVRRRDLSLRILKGVVMAIPVLIVFAVLFTQADLAFSRFINGFIDISISPQSVQYLVLLLFAFVSALSFLSYLSSPQPVQAAAADDSGESQSDRSIEVMVFLGLICSLFLVFIGFQVTYLFGGEANITNAGFTYAEYARRGFWELLAVAVLSLLVLLGSEKYAGAESRKIRRFHLPALLLVAEVVVVIVSALKRLSLYIDAYGMTAQRFYAAGFIVLLMALFVLLAVKFLTGRQERFFAFGGLLSVAAFLIVLNLINPDGFIMSYNLERHSRTGKLDISYLSQLSADADPGKIELYRNLDGSDKAALHGLLMKQKEVLRYYGDNWQSANFSRARALKLLNEIGNN